MKVLLSAYACEPNKGSEPGVGWHWAIELAKLGHETWVITRENNRNVIEAADYPENLHFIYYDLPKWARWWKKGGRGVYLYYLLWQWGAYQAAKKVHAIEQFELVHHVTFVSVRQPSFMGELGIPFIFGPVGGGESAPWRLRKGFGISGQIKDAIRDVMNQLVRFDPMMRRTFRKASKIYVTSEQTKALLPAKYQKISQVQLAIGIDGCKSFPRISRKGDELKVLYVGRFLSWKGMLLGIDAFAAVLKKEPQARLTIVGKGPAEKKWKNLAIKLGIENHIEWIAWIDQNELKKLYEEHDVFLFPSLHDSGGMVVLEAMSLALPVVCLDLGGPGVMVNEKSGKRIVTQDQSYQQIVIAIANELTNLIVDQNEYCVLSNGAVKRSKQFEWTGTVSSIYGDLKL